MGSDEKTNGTSRKGVFHDKKKECMRKYHLLYGGLAVPDWHPELAQPSHNHDDYSEVAGMEAGRMERQKAPEPRQSC